jgi:probable rRNA maturation factor
LKIHFHTEEISFSVLQEEKICYWIESIISEYGFVTGELSFVFCSDEYLLKLNKTFLNHDYYTDVITFNDNVDRIINGDIYISIERVRENAASFSVSDNEELKRVMIHGVLHLVGFSDDTDDLKLIIRQAEDRALQKVGDLKII